MRKMMASCLAILCWILGEAQTTYPINGVADPQNETYAFINATLIKDPKTTLTNSTLVIRKGIIVAVGNNVSIPAEATVIDCKGKYIYPSFIDIFSDYGTNPPQRGAAAANFADFFSRRPQFVSNTKGAYGWNQAIRPEMDVVTVFATQESRAKELRAQGFGAVLTHSTDGIARGTGAFVTLASEKENKVIIREKVSQHFSFDKGTSTQDYPASLMGVIALLRQTYLDADWYKSKPAEEGVNLSLQAFNNNRSLPAIFEANDKWNVLRADKVGDEFGVQYIIKTNGNEYQRLAEIKSTQAALIVPVNFPQAMEVEDPTDARYVAYADMKHWEMAPGNTAALEKAGIRFALTLYGLRESNTFFSNLRKAIKYGLSEEKALEALTTTPAQLIGVNDKTGSLENGKLANFLITSGPLFHEKTVLFQNWVQGKKYTLKEEGWMDLRGTYNLTVGPDSYQLDVKGEAGRPSASLIRKDTTKVDLAITDKVLKMNYTLKSDNNKSTRLTGVLSGEEWSGLAQLPDGKSVPFKAIRTKGLEPATDSVKKQSITDIGPVTYPLNGYGWSELPVQETLLIKNATVWTNESEGILSNADVLIQGGKIAGVGKNLSSAGARVIDASGKHVSAGIIDEHSHIALAAINEGSQSVTSEVREQDVINPDDINIYWQLAGGVTTSHLLHGSANTIGGQTVLIKLRWGKNAEELKFSNWDPFIKFALGENVKQSSRPTSGERFPQTRMGVAQVVEDAFTRAKDYEKAWKEAEALSKKKGSVVPVVRRDLELEALVEILNKKRFITCHSYVQSEINALIKVADKMGFTVNTFTHILEGYKVADQMKAHGANASTFSDWWNYKMEVTEAIPYNPWLMQQRGLTVAINSDDAEQARRLNQEAAKSVKYGGMQEQEALKMVTLNPAKMLHIADRVGSLKVGKDADLVIWSDHPLSQYAKAEKTLVDGIIYFDRERDAQLRKQLAENRNKLVQKMISAKKGGDRTAPASPRFEVELDCEDDEQMISGLEDFYKY